MVRGLQGGGAVVTGGQTRYERSGVVRKKGSSKRVLSRRGQGGRAGVRGLEKADAHEEGARTQHLDEH